MNMRQLISEIKLELTGNLLELELPDSTLKLIVQKGLRELQRYIDETKIVTVPYASCIDLDKSKVSSVTKVYRTEGYVGETEGGTSLLADPMYAQQWMVFSNGGSMYNLNEYVLNYLSWNTLLQMKNTVSTDLAFRVDVKEHKLYINNAFDKPTMISIEFVPKLEDVKDIETDYWLDILIRLCVALTKVTLGRIRTRYTQANALWTQDGETMLAEGLKELEELRAKLEANSQLFFPVD